MENIRNGDVFAIKYSDGSINDIIIVTDYLNNQYMEISYDKEYDSVYYYKNRNVDERLSLRAKLTEYVGHINGDFSASIFNNEEYKAIYDKLSRKQQICSSKYCIKVPIKLMMNSYIQKDIIRDNDAIYSINNFKEVLDKTIKLLNEETIIIDVNYSSFRGELHTIGRIVDFSNDYEYAYVFISEKEDREKINSLKTCINFTFKYSIDYEFENIQFRHIEEIRYSQLLEGGN
jgi:hypothetical protein